MCCELLSDFVYSFFEHNPEAVMSASFPGCELLSDFVYSFFEHNVKIMDKEVKKL